MSKLSQVHYLYLYCSNLNYFPENLETFIKSCQDIGFLANRYQKPGPEHYLVGDRFLQHVSFLGCSPYLKVHPETENDTDFCTASIPASSTAINYLASQHVTAPRCPVCKKSIAKYQTIMQEWTQNKSNTLIECQQCGESSALYDLDWRKNAGFFNFHIAISNIFPKEAIPGDALLDWLQATTKHEWKYFYI